MSDIKIVDRIATVRTDSVTGTAGRCCAAGKLASGRGRAATYLAKPFRSRQLLDEVARVLG